MSGSKPTIQELDKHLKRLVGWQRFAVHLPGIDMSMIRTVQKNYDDNDDQKFALCDKWLRVYTDPSWEDVINALKAVDENTIAEQLAEQFCHQQTEMFGSLKCSGYSLEIFIDAPPKKVICPLCSLVERDPYLIGCCGELTMCKMCLEQCQECPKCHEIPDLCSSVPNPGHRKAIMKLRVRCTKRGCLWEGELANLEAHISGHEEVMSDAVSDTVQLHSSTDLSCSESTVKEVVKLVKPLSDVSKSSDVMELGKPLEMQKSPLPPKPKSIALSQPRVNEISGTTAKLSWEKPCKLNPPFKPIEYSVSYCTTDGTWIDYDKSTKAEAIEVAGLIPNETYCFKIKAFDHAANQFVESKPSKSVKLAKAISDAPGKPMVNAVSENSITVEWTPPNNIREDVKVYVVSFSLKDHELWNVLETTKTNATVTNLVPNTCYLFKVQAKWESAESQVSEVSRVLTNNAAPDSPGKPQCKSVGNDFIELFWESPKNETSVDKYELVSFKIPGNSEIQRNTTEKNVFTVKNLSPHIKYYFTVRALYANNCMSEFSQYSETISTLKPLPYILQKPKATNVTSTSVSLEWCPSDQEEVSKYMISYASNKDAAVKGIFKVVKTPDNFPMYTISNLVPNTEYVFRVAAKSQSLNKYGNESALSDCIRTKPLFSSSPPGKPKATEVTSTSVTLEWFPSTNHEDVSKYMISYAVATKTAEEHNFKTSTNIPKCTIPDLKPNTEYVFRVQAKSQSLKEYSDQSEPSDVVRTKPLRPSPPGKPQVVSRTCNSIELKWAIPETNASSVKLYAIHYISTNMYQKLENIDEWPIFQTKFYQTHANITNLDSGTEYCFRVAATICDGGFSFSEPIYWVRTKHVLNPPGKPYAENITERSIHLKWKKPLVYDHSQLTYKLYMASATERKFSCSHPSPVYILTTQAEKAQINNLSPNTVYFFQVEAVNLDDDVAKSVLSDAITTGKEVPGPPGKPFMLHVAHDAVKLAWERPDQMSKADVSHYQVYYKHPSDSTWKQKRTTQTNLEISDLQHSTQYIFKVVVCNKEGDLGNESEISETVALKCPLPSAPGKPVGKPHSSNRGTINLTWTRPQTHYENVKYYEISYHQDSQKSSERKIILTNSRVEQYQVTKLSPGTGYYFDVKAVTHSGETSATSFLSDLISIERFAEAMLPQCHKIDEVANIPIYLLPKTVMHNDSNYALKRFDIKLSKEQSYRPTKVLMLVGATGSGKSTLIDAIVNYIMGVEHGDHFRYKLVQETPTPLAHVNMKRWITSYTIRHEPGFQMPFSLTIIDTPGFDDTESSMEITRQFKFFFSMQDSISHIDGIGFVCQAGLVRLTPTQRYIFDSVFAMFGNDIKDNIFILCTFCDGGEPAVINAMEEARIPTGKFFKFNNSDLISRGSLGEAFWNIGTASFREFCRQIETVSSVSLRLTKEVLQQRETLESIVSSLQQQTNAGVNLIMRLRREIDILEKNKAIIENNWNFTYEIKQDVMVEVKLNKGEYTLNCLKCNMVCQYPCSYPNDESKKYSHAFVNPGSNNAHCRVCPGQCHWSQHRSASFRLKTETRVVKKEYKEMKKKYEDAVNQNSSVKKVIESLQSQIDKEFEVVFNYIRKGNDCTKKLDEIAFRPNHLIDVKYIQLLIDAQYQEKRKGYQERIKYYRILQEKAETVAKIRDIGAKAVKGDKRWWEKFYMR